MSLEFDFGNFALDETNNFHPGTWRELHGAERVLSIIKSSGTRGIKVLSDTFEGKVIELTGFLKYDNAEDMVLGVQSFITNMLKPGEPLVITNHLGEFVYDGCYVTNPEDLFALRRHDFQSHIEVRLVFLAPKGFARSTTRTDTTVDNITALPYSGSITIDGDTNPEPVISIALVDASTIDSVYFINNTTNMQISAEGLTLVDGDVITIDIENKELRLNAMPISFDGVFPRFIPGINQYQLSAAGGSNLIINQSQYNAEEVVYGSNKLGWKFTAPSTSDLSQIALLIKKVSGTVYQTLDDFEDSSLNGTIWPNQAGTFAEEGGKLRVGKKSGSGSSGEVSTGARTGVTGFEIPFDWDAGGSEGPNVYISVWSDGAGATGGSVRVRSQHAVNKTTIEGTGAMAGLSSHTYTGKSGTLKVEQDGATLNVYISGTLILSGTYELGGAPRVELKSDGGSGTNFYMQASVVYERVVSSANSDITVSIETDSTGDPSGTPITDGTITIPVSEVGTSFSEILKGFSTEPSITNATVYHVVISQTGGDINNYYVIKKQNTDVFADANLETYDGSSWTQLTTQDLYVKIWSTAPTGFDIDLAIRYFKSYFNVG